MKLLHIIAYWYHRIMRYITAGGQRRWNYYGSAHKHHQKMKHHRRYLSVGGVFFM